MYGIFTYIYPKNGPNVGKYSIHGASGIMMTGWWLGHPSEKRLEFVNWDEDSNPIFMGKCKKWQPNHQPDDYDGCFLAANT